MAVQDDKNDMNKLEPTTEPGAHSAPVDADFAAQARRNVELTVRSEQMQMMYHHLLPGMWASTLSAALLCWVLWPAVAPLRLQIWFGAIVIVSLVRTLIAISYRREDAARINARRWERLCSWPHFANSLVWGFGGLIVMPQEPVADQMLVYYFLVGISCGSANLYAIQNSLKTWTLVCFVVPSTVWFFLQGQLIHFTMAITGTILLLATIRGMKDQASLLQHSYELTYELQMAKAAAEQLARTDTLTGLHNRRAFGELGAAMLRQAQRQAFPVSGVMLDIDHFKKINDTYGHAAGDAALRHLAHILRDSLRQSDVCGRLGGEEFTILLPGTDITHAHQLAEKIRLRIANAPITWSGSSFSMSASFGVTCGGNDMDTLLRRADAALYRAKESGRNCVVSQAPDAPA